MSESLNTAVLFLVFNRLDTTKQVFESIRQAKPARLYIAADGARETVPEDLKKVKDVRDFITTNINCVCEVKTLFRDKNLGCKHAVSSAISWFFEIEEMGIILEDDCLPSKSFFQYCQELLHYYRDNPRIMVISGDNFQDGKKRGNCSYYFSRFPHIWGWATWRRAWEKYDLNMSTFLDFEKNNEMAKIFRKRCMQIYWMKIFNLYYLSKIDTWDFQWLYSEWYNNGIGVIPNVNLISNIGFGKDALHTKDENSKSAALTTKEIQFPLIHPSIIEIDETADYYTFKKEYSSNLFAKIFHKMKRYFKKAD